MSRIGRPAAALLLLVLGGCMPWAVGQTAELVPPGKLDAGVGASVLVSPDEPRSVFPVPQAAVRLGVARWADVGLSYAFPMTGYADLKLRLAEGSRGAAAASLGAGLHAVPVGLDEGASTPVLGAAVLISSRARSAPVWYGAVRAFLPFHAGDDPAALLWLSGTVGAEWGRARWRVGPELGLVSSVLRPADVLLSASVTARRRVR